MIAVTTADAKSQQRRATRQEKYIFQQVKLAEAEYGRKLRRLGYNIASMAREMLKSADPNNKEVFIELSEVFRRYGDAITPWARTVAARMMTDTALRDAKIWRKRSEEMSWDLEEVIRRAPIGQVMQQGMQEQIDLITSIPYDIAQDVHQMAIAAQFTGERFGSIAKMIQQKADTSVSRANLIARTEVARAATELTRARAEFAGSPGYIWRTAQDSDVRPRHRKLDGKYIKWDDPPIAGEKGERAHAGQIYNCRCICDVVVPGIKPDLQTWRYVGGV